MQLALHSRGLPRAALLRRWARAAVRARAEVTLRVVGAAEGRRLNLLFRRTDRPTNVLAFDYGERPRRGDIVLCHPVIAREARAQGKTLEAHYAHLVVHAILHLHGRDHARRAERARMEREEIRVLARLGIGNPYAVK